MDNENISQEEQNPPKAEENSVENTANTAENDTEDVQEDIVENVTNDVQEDIAEAAVAIEKKDEKQKDKKDMENRKIKSGEIVFCGVLLAMVAGAFGFRGYVANNYVGITVDGASMNQTLQSGDQLLMKRLKSADDLQRGDVIVVDVKAYEEFKGTNTQYLIKRLIALEGDKVRCTDGQVEICYAGTTEYVLLDEPYAYYTNKNLYDFSEYVVGEDEIFFLGDNRNNSCDSRYKEISGSHLDCLYKETDIHGVVSDWAIENRSWVSKLFFWKEDLKNKKN